jgi:hypothetical protein
MKRPTESRGPWHYEEALTSLEQLATARPDLGSLSELPAAVRDAQPVGYEWLAQRPACRTSDHDLAGAPEGITPAVDRGGG